MKKVFSIISVCMMAVIVAFICTLCFVKTNVPIVYGSPYYINVFNHSTTSVGSKSFEKTDASYETILKELNKVTNVSIFNRLKDGGTLKPEIKQDLEEKFTKYSTDVKKDNVVVELIFQEQQDIVVWFEGSSKVVSYVCLLYVIPDANKLDEILVYHSPTADSTNSAKETAYAECEPFILFGNGNGFSEFVKTLS